MNEQVSDRRVSPRSSLDEDPRKSDDLSEFVVIDKNEDSLATLNFDFERPERSQGEEAAKETKSTVELTDREQEASDLPPRVLHSRTPQKSSSVERRWKIERANPLSEEKMIAVDNVQSRLAAILGTSGNIEQGDDARKIKMFRSLSEALPEPEEGPRVIETTPATKPRAGNSATTSSARTDLREDFSYAMQGQPPRDKVETSRDELQKRVPREELMTSLPLHRLAVGPSKLGRSLESSDSPSYVTFGRSDPDEIESPSNGELKEEEEGSNTIEVSEPYRRQYQNEDHQNLCSLCGRPVPAFREFAIELNGYHYHKRCIVDNYFSPQELSFVLRGRCPRHETRSKSKKKTPAWCGITTSLSRLFRKKK